MAASTNPTPAEHDAVSYTVHDGVAHIRLNRPRAHNALAPESVRRLAGIWRDFMLDRNARVGIVSGEGDNFCAGMDMKRTDPGFGDKGVAGAAQDRYAALAGERRRVAYVPPADCYKPLIAAISGVAVGGGLELALACDIRIAAEGARFGLPEVSRGLVPGSGGLYWLSRCIGHGPAMEMILTGGLIDAQEAYRLRLVNRVVPRDGLLAAAQAMAAQIAANAPLATQGAKETAVRALGAGLQEGLWLSEQQGRHLRMTEDFTEGIEAFAQKRAPVFRGR